METLKFWRLPSLITLTLLSAEAIKTMLISVGFTFPLIGAVVWVLLISLPLFVAGWEK